MIPTWDTALKAALDHLAPDGRLYIVDFWDQADLPSVVGTALQRWLRLFDVEPRPDLLRTLHQLDAEGRLSCSITPVARRYAYLATVAPRDNGSTNANQTPSSMPGQSEIPPESKRFGSEKIIAA
jgi:S-adenosylmethionine-diacylgycerolhomoserine-N-methlytransferase